jgi:hypothetical protein
VIQYEPPLSRCRCRSSITTYHHQPRGPAFCPLPKTSARSNRCLLTCGPSTSTTPPRRRLVKTLSYGQPARTHISALHHFTSSSPPHWPSFPRCVGRYFGQIRLLPAWNGSVLPAIERLIEGVNTRPVEILLQSRPALHCIAYHYCNRRRTTTAITDPTPLTNSDSTRHAHSLSTFHAAPLS